MPATGSWRVLLREAIRDPRELRRRLGLPESLGGEASVVEAAHREFPLLVPEPYLARMRPGDPADPLLLQVLPQAEEMAPAEGFVDDPVGEFARSDGGLVSKYAGRRLMVSTGACAIACRYCFRRHYPYQDRARGRRWWMRSLAEIQQDSNCEELILSGGDPLTLPDEELSELLGDASMNARLNRLRIHTRLPVVLPQRIDAGLLSALAAWRQARVMVLHINHPRELDGDVGAACERLRAAGFVLLNQSVLLAGVNDRLEVLVELSRRIFAFGIVPYYLHVLDRVRGAAHFMVQDAVAIDLVNGMRERLPGYLVPRLVREESGRPAKTVLA